MENPADLSAIPSGMDNDPAADEEVINQQQGESIPSGVSTPKSEPDDDEQTRLANQIAYALDGSGAGLPGSTPIVGSEQTVVTEGTTGANPSEDI